MDKAVGRRIRFRRDAAHEKEPIPVEQWLEDGKGSADNFYFLFVPDDPSTADLRMKIEERIHELPNVSGEPTIELLAKPYRVLWRPPHAIVLGGNNPSEELFSALVEFAFLEDSLRKLETSTNNHLEACREDIPLTHAVGPSDLRRQTHINQLTEQVVSSQMELVRLVPCFDKLYGKLTPQTKYVIEALAEKTRVWDDRIEALEDQLESLWDLYELANDRLTEFSYFGKEFWLEWSIIVLLVLELAVMIWEAISH